MVIHVTNETSKSWQVAYAIKKAMQLFSNHRVSKIVSSLAVKKKVVYCVVE